MGLFKTLVGYVRINKPINNTDNYIMAEIYFKIKCLIGLKLDPNLSSQQAFVHKCYNCVT